MKTKFRPNISKSRGSKSSSSSGAKSVAESQAAAAASGKEKETPGGGISKHGGSQLVGNPRSEEQGSLGQSQ